MLERILGFIRKPTSRDVIINTVGNYLNVVFTVFFVVLLVRVLNPSKYGEFGVLLGIAYVLANILDFGTTASIYSYLPEMIEKKHKNLYVFLKTIFVYQTVFSLIIIAGLFISFPYLDKVFFKTGAPKYELYLTTFSVLFFVWQNYITNAMNAAKEFFKINLWTNLSNVIKTVVIVALIPFHLVTVGSIIFIFGLLGPAIFFAILFYDKKHVFVHILKASVVKSEFRFAYTLTFFIGSQFLNLSQRIDLFLLSYFMSRSNDVGYYVLAQKIILTIITAISSITQVLSPNFAQIKKKAEIRQQFKHGLLYLSIPAVLFLVLYLTPSWVFTLVFTKNYDKTTAISHALSLPFIIFVAINLPVLFLLYTVKKPAYVLYAYMAIFVIIAAGCYYLIPKYGVFGPPYAMTAAFIVSLLILSGATWKEYKNYKE